MAASDDSGREMRETDPDVMARALELELQLKRMSWKKTRERRNAWRVASISFLLLIVLGGLLACFYFLPQLRERREEAKSAHVER